MTFKSNFKDNSSLLVTGHMCPSVRNKDNNCEGFTLKSEIVNQRSKDIPDKEEV